MQADKLIKAIRSHKGKLYVPVHCKNGTLHIAVEKSDLIAALVGYGSKECEYEMYKMDDGTFVVGAEH